MDRQSSSTAPTHAVTAHFRLLLHDNGRLADARPLLEQALAERRAALGEAHVCQ